MGETINERRARQIRKSTYGKEVREPIARAVESTERHLNKSVDKIEQKHRERIVQVSTEPILSRPGYFTLVLTRKNGQ